MQDPLVNQVDKPYLPQESNQPVNAPPVLQPQIIQQPSQPYIVQLVNPSYAPQSIPQPYIIQTQAQPQIIQTVATQPYNTQPSLPVVIDPHSLKKKLCCLKVWLPIKFIPLIIDIIFSFSYYIPPIVQIAGVIVLIIVNCLVYRSTEINGAKKYKIALHTYTIYFIFACIFYLFFIFGTLNYYYLRDYSFYEIFRYNYKIVIYLIELGIEITTLYLLNIFKKEFNLVPNNENQISTLPLQV